MSETNNFVYTGTDLDVMGIASNYNNWILDLFESYTTKGRAIEVGAGVGTMSKLIAQRYQKTISIEPDQTNFDFLTKELQEFDHASTFCGFLDNALDAIKEPVDSIFYINVLEHIENEKEELLKAQKLLKSTGHFCIFVPAVEKLYGDIDKQVGHFRRYSKKRLKSIFEDQLNMNIVKMGYFDFVGVIPWYILSCVLKLSGQNPKTVTIYDKLVVPIMSRIEKYIPMPIGKNLYLIASFKNEEKITK